MGQPLNLILTKEDYEASFILCELSGNEYTPKEILALQAQEYFSALNVDTNMDGVIVPSILNVGRWKHFYIMVLNKLGSGLANVPLSFSVKLRQECLLNLLEVHKHCIKKNMNYDYI